MMTTKRFALRLTICSFIHDSIKRAVPIQPSSAIMDRTKLVLTIDPDQLGFIIMNFTPQCYGNKLQACAINHIQVDSFQQENTRETLIVEYINCLMTNVFADQAYGPFARRCATAVGVKTFDSIEACANSTDGSKYLEQMGEMTHKLMDPLKSVPTITVRETFDQAIQNQALTDFSSTVCQNLPKPQPAVCRAYSSATALTTSIATGILALVAAFIRMY